MPLAPSSMSFPSNNKGIIKPKTNRLPFSIDSIVGQNNSKRIGNNNTGESVINHRNEDHTAKSPSVSPSASSSTGKISPNNSPNSSSLRLNTPELSTPNTGHPFNSIAHHFQHHLPSAQSLHQQLQQQHSSSLALSAAIAYQQQQHQQHQQQAMMSPEYHQAMALYPWLYRGANVPMNLPGRFHPFDGELSSFLLPPIRKPKRIRTSFSSKQLLKLEKAFEKNHYGKLNVL